MRKLLLYFVALLFSFNAISQVTIGTVNPGPYGKGSSVFVPFRIDASSWCGAPNNKFELWISASNFSADSVLIGTYNSSWARFINGLIPVDHQTFGSHAFKIKTTAPVTSTLSSGTISIVNNTGPDALVTLITGQQPLYNLVRDTAFGACGNSSSIDLRFIKPSGNTATLTGNIYNESLDVVLSSNLSFTSTATTVSIANSYYTMDVVSTDANGTKSTRGYLLTNKKTNLNIGVQGFLQGCMPDSLPIQIGVTGDAGIEFNYPGTVYVINWGDNTPVDSFSHCDLMSRRLGNTITVYHLYANSSCGEPDDKYIITFSVKAGFESQNLTVNNTCATQPTSPVLTSAYIYKKPLASFTSPLYACVNSAVTFSNTTTSGLNQNCADEADFIWIVNGNVVQGPSSVRDLVYTFPTPGQYTIQLISENYSCDPDTATQSICIEPVPVPAFTMLSGVSTVTAICTGQTLTLQDNSNMIGLTCKNPTYQWTISPNSGFSFVGNTGSGTANPQIQFSEPGTYTITQIISNSCGSQQVSQQISVTGAPSVTFPTSSFVYCTLPAPSLEVDFSQQPHRPTYSTGDYPATSFTWTVGGVGVTSSDYVFINSTNSNSQYPQIRFTSFKDYVITVSVGSSCPGGSSSTYTISIREKPVLSAIPAQTICSENAFTSASLGSNLTGTTFSWVVSATNTITGFTTPGTGATINGVTLTNPTNTPGTVTYTVTPALNSCTGATQNLVVTVNPKPKVPNSTRLICSGETFNFAPTNSQPTTIIPASTTYTWTVVDNTNVTGESSQAVGQSSISQTLINNSSVAQQVVYTVVPTSGTAGNCVGSSFTLTVTINPKATISDIITSTCSGVSFSATPDPSSNTIPAATLYSWSAPIVTGGLTGGAPASNQTSVNGTLNNPTNSVQTATYTVTPTSGTCSSNTFLVTVTVNPKPVVPAQTRAICSGETFTVSPQDTDLNTIIPANTTYTWTVLPNANVTGESDEATPQVNISQTLTNTTNQVQTVVYTVTPTSGDQGSCVGSTFTVTVTVNPRPSISAQTTSTCSGVGFTFAASNGSGNIVPGTTSYSWSAPVVTGGVSGGASGSGSSITGTLVNPTNVSQTATYTVTPTSGSCGGGSFVLTVTVNPKPVVPAQTQTICSGGAFTITPLNDEPTTIIPTNTTYTWTVASNTNVSGQSAQASPQSSISQTLTNLTNQVQTVVYTVTPTSGATGACVGATFTVTVTVNPKPVVPAQVSTICSGQTFTVSPTNNQPTTIIPSGTTYTWTVVDNPAVTGESDEATPQANISQTLTNSTNQSQQVVYTVTPTSGAQGSCEGASFTVTVTVSPKPIISDKTDEICSGTAFTVTPQNGGAEVVPVGTVYTWTVQPNASVTGESNQTSTQANISQTLTNTTNQVQTVVYTVTPSVNGSCVGNTFLVTVTVNPKPVVPAQTRAICSGETFTVSPQDTDPNTIIPANTTYTWTVVDNPDVTGESAEATPQANISQTLTNTTNQVQTVVYTVTPTSGDQGSCVGSTFTVTVTVNPRPSISAQTTSTCSGVGFTFAASNGSGNIVPGTTSYSWSAPVVTGGVSGGASGSGSSITGTLVNPTNVSQTATYTVTPTSGSCGGGSFVLTVTVNPKPVVPAQTQTICSGGAFTITPLNDEPTTIIPTNTTYTWTVASNTNVSGQSAQASPQSSISQTLTNLTNQVQTVVYTVTPTSGATGACVGATFTVTVTVNPKPVVPAQVSTICSGQTFTVSPTNNQPTTIIPSGTTYTWTVVDNPAVTGESDEATPQANISQTLTNSTNQSQQVVYTVTPTSGAQGSCEGASFTVTVTVSPKPIISDKTDEICSGTAFTVTPQNGGAEVVPVGTVYTWTVQPNASVTGESNQTSTQANISQTLTNTTNQVQTVVYTVTPSVNGSCVGNTFLVTVTVNPKPVVPAQTRAICSGETFTVSPQDTDLNTIIPANTTYTWTVLPNANVTGESDEATPQVNISQTLTNTTNQVQTVVYTVTPTSGDQGSCVGSTFTVTVTVNPRPSISAQTTSTCSGVGFTFAASNGSGNIVPGTTSYSWSAPVVTGGVSGGASGSGSSITGTLVNPTNVSQTATYTVTPTSGSCGGGSFVLTVTVNPKPVVPAQTQTICSGGAFTITPLNDEPTTIIPTNTTYTWTVASNTNVSGQSAQASPQSSISQTLTNLTNQVQTVVYTVTPTSGATGACVGATFTVTVTVNPKPVVPAQVSTICSGQTFTVSPTNNQPTTIIPSGTTYTWTVVDNPAVTGESDEATPQANISQTLTNSTNQSQQVVYTVTPTSGAQGSCEGASFTVTVTVSPKPTVLNESAVICSGQTFSITPTEGNGNIVPIGTTYTWAYTDNPNVSGEASNNTQLSSIGGTLTNNTNIVQAVVYTVTPSVGGSCVGTDFTATVTVNPKPVIPAQSQTICNDGTFLVNPVNAQPTTIVPINTTYTWTVAANANVTGQSNQPAAQPNISQTLTNNTTSVQTVEYTVTPVSGAPGACVGDPFTTTIAINPDAKAAFNIDTTIGCVPYRLRDHVTLVPHVNANSQPDFSWYADGVLIGTGATVPNFSITQPGDTVVIKLFAKSLFNCRDDSLSVTIYTIEQPQPSFTQSVDTACGPATVLFTNTTTPINVINGSTYNWDFGNGQTSTQVQPGNIIFQPHPNHTDTTYQISLTVSTLCESITYRDSVLVRPSPLALFQPDTTVYCSPANMRFRNNSRGVDNSKYGESNRYIWDWGDGRRDTVTDNRTMTKLYTTGIIDTITVKLYAYNECGVDSFAVDVVLYPATITPSLIVFGQNTFGCAPKPVTFVNNSVGGSSYTIDFGDGSPNYITNQSNDTISHIYNNPGTYTVSMRSQNTCTDTTVYQLINIYANPDADFNLSSPTYCLRDTTRITNTTTPTGIQYLWNMGDGSPTFTGVVNPNYVYRNPGTYTVTLIATSTFNAGASCKDTISKQVTIHPVPTAAFSSNLSTYNCAPFNLSAYATPANYSSVEWYVLSATGTVVFSSTGFTVSHTLSNPGAYQLKMIGYNSFGCSDSLTTPFEVQISPSVSYSVPDTVYCGLSSTVTFTNTSTYSGGGTTAYQWYVNGILQSTDPNSFTYNFTIPGTATVPLVYNVKLVATASVTGCAPAYERTITILPAGQVNQVVNQLVCDGSVVAATQFSTVNSGGITTYAWTNSNPTIGLAASGTGPVPSFTAVNNGLSPVISTITITPTFTYGGRSCEGPTKEYTITVNPPAQVDQPADLVVCNTQLTSVNFTSSNTGGTTAYSWTNDNPSIGILAGNTGNIAVFYAINTGTSPVVANITVTPSYTNGGVTCPGSSKTFTITVLPTVNMDQPANQVVCSGSTVNFNFASSASGGTVTYRWVNDNPAIGLVSTGTGNTGTFTATNLSNNPATATITVTPTFTFNGKSCDGPSKTFTITVNPNGQVDQPQSQVKCNGDLALGTRFTTLQTGGVVSYTWVNSEPAIGLAPFGSGDIDSFRVVNTGVAPLIATITVTPTFTNEGVSCSGGTKSFTITVNPTASVNPIPDVQVCDGVRTNPVTFNSTATGGSIVYSWTNSNTSIGLGASGIGNLPSFTAINSSSTPIVATITVTPTYTNAGVSCVGNPRSFTITVLPLPQTRFRVTPDSACAPMVVTFTNLTQYADTYQWLLNNVQFSTLHTPPPMVLTQPGTVYTFTLVAGNAQGGCGPTSFTYTVKTLPTPRAQFSINSNTADTLYACKQLTAQVTNASYLNTPGNIIGLSYQWYINNQLQSTAPNPRFQLNNTSFNRDSLVVIKLIVGSAAGCIDSVKRWVRLYPEPLASFVINGGNSDCAKPQFGLVKTVQNNSLVKQPAQYSWSIYNRTSASPSHGVVISNINSATPSFTFPDNLSAVDTTYDIRLLVTSPDGCTKDTVISQVVYARPIVNFRITDSVSCTGTLNVSFLDLSVSPTSSITSRLWNFDDGGVVSTLPAVSHIYSSYGAYYPSLYVTNARGCISDTMRKRIVVFGAPTADFIASTPVCVGTPVTFTNTSQLGWGSTQFTQIQWDFGDGTTSTAMNPTHAYTSPGTYTVFLTVKSDSSCVSRTKSLTVTIAGKPKADFIYSNSCVNTPTQFTNLSTGGFAETGYSVVGWDFGNGLQSLQNNPIITYANPGSYNVQLIVSGITCPHLKDTVQKTLVIRQPRPDSIYPRIFASKLNRFTMSALPGGLSYLWAPPIGLSHPTRAITDAYYLPADPQKINYIISIKDSSGCVNNDQQEVWIFEKPDVYAPTAFTPNNDGANDNFIPFYINIKRLESFRVFNRWGSKIFETNDMSKAWDGTINSTNAPLETYTWVVECYDVDGNKLVRKGMVTLIRN